MVGDDLLHELVNVKIVEAVGRAHLCGALRIVRDQPDRARMMSVEILDDHRRLGHGPSACGVLQHGKLPNGP